MHILYVDISSYIKLYIYIIVYYSVLYYIILYCIILYYIILSIYHMCIYIINPFPIVYDLQNRNFLDRSLHLIGFTVE